MTDSCWVTAPSCEPQNAKAKIKYSHPQSCDDQAHATLTHQLHGCPLAMLLTQLSSMTWHTSHRELGLPLSFFESGTEVNRLPFHFTMIREIEKISQNLNPSLPRLFHGGNRLKPTLWRTRTLKSSKTGWLF